MDSENDEAIGWMAQSARRRQSDYEVIRAANCTGSLPPDYRSWLDGKDDLEIRSIAARCRGNTAPVSPVPPVSPVMDDGELIAGLKKEIVFLHESLFKAKAKSAALANILEKLLAEIADA